MSSNGDSSSVPTPAPPRRPGWKALVFGGLIPLVAYAVIEDQFGVQWGLLAGLAFGLGEILWEWTRERKVSKLTLFSNGLLLVLGGISWITNEGVWFKLQPAMLEAAMALLLWVPLVLRADPLAWLMTQQGHPPPDPARPFLRGLAFRMGVFFAIHAAIAVEAALHWSTEAWILLKGAGLTGSFIVYLVCEFLLLRTRLRPRS